jgi:hypothetical protein
VNQSQNDLRSGCLMVFQIQLAGLVVIDFWTDLLSIAIPGRFTEFQSCIV